MIQTRKQADAISCQSQCVLLFVWKWQVESKAELGFFSPQLALLALKGWMCVAGRVENSLFPQWLDLLRFAFFSLVPFPNSSLC